MEAGYCTASSDYWWGEKECGAIVYRDGDGDRSTKSPLLSTFTIPLSRKICLHSPLCAPPAARVYPSAKNQSLPLRGTLTHEYQRKEHMEFPR